MLREAVEFPSLEYFHILTWTKAWATWSKINADTLQEAALVTPISFIARTKENQCNGIWIQNKKKESNSSYTAQVR